MRHIYIYIYNRIERSALPVTTIMALWQLVNLGTRCTVTHCRIALWSAQTASSIYNIYITKLLLILIAIVIITIIILLHLLTIVLYALFPPCLYLKLLILYYRVATATLTSGVMHLVRNTQTIQSSSVIQVNHQINGTILEVSY